MGARHGIVIAGVLAVSACNSGDDPAPTTVPVSTVAATTTAVPPTTQAATTSIPTTTSAPPTTAASTTAPTVSAASTTAPLDPLVDLAAAIERDLNLGEQALFVIGANPAAANVRQLAEQYFAEASLANVLAGIETLVQDDLLLQPDPAIPNVVRLVTEPVLDPATNRATARTCRIDAAQTWGRVNDTDVRVPISTGSVKILADSVFVLVDGTWKLADGTSVSREEGGSTCD